MKSSKQDIIAILSQRKLYLEETTGWERANLRGANLRGANLSGTNLSGANLRGADLTDTNQFTLATPTKATP